MPANDDPIASLRDDIADAIASNDGYSMPLSTHVPDDAINGGAVVEIQEGGLRVTLNLPQRGDLFTLTAGRTYTYPSAPPNCVWRSSGQDGQCSVRRTAT